MHDNVLITNFADLTETHIASALYNATKALELEPELKSEMDAHGGRSSGPKLIAHRAHVIGTVIFAGAFVESHINAIFGGYKNQPDAPKSLQLRDEWANQDFRQRTSTIDKYKKAAQISDVVLDKGSKLSQEMLAVLDLRNYYVHGKPDEITVESDKPGITRPPSNDKMDLQRLEEDIFLRNIPRLAVHPILNGPANSLLNEKGVTACLARWAVNSCLAFVDDFDKKIGDIGSSPGNWSVSYILD